MKNSMHAHLFAAALAALLAGPGRAQDLARARADLKASAERAAVSLAAADPCGEHPALLATGFELNLSGARGASLLRLRFNPEGCRVYDRTSDGDAADPVAQYRFASLETDYVLTVSVAQGGEEGRLTLDQYTSDVTSVGAGELGAVRLDALLSGPCALGRAEIGDYKVRFTELSGQAEIAPSKPRAAELRAFSRPACWTRGVDAEADALGLPMSFCLERAQLSERPFFENKEALKVEGSLAGAFPLHLRESEDGFELRSEIFQANRGFACPGGLRAELVLSLGIDRSGRFLEAEPKLSGFVSKPGWDCEGGWDSREISYLRTR